MSSNHRLKTGLATFFDKLSKCGCGLRQLVGQDLKVPIRQISPAHAPEPGPNDGAKDVFRGRVPIESVLNGFRLGQLAPIAAKPQCTARIYHRSDSLQRLHSLPPRHKSREPWWPDSPGRQNTRPAKITNFARVGSEAAGARLRLTTFSLGCEGWLFIFKQQFETYV